MLGPPAWAAVAELARAPAQTCVLTDFDGTLAPIVGDPADANALPGALDVLHRLARRFGTVAVVSGRPAAFLVPRLALGEGRSPLRAYGSYGAERAGPDGHVTAPERAAGEAESIEAAARELEAGLPAGVEVERKRWSVALHWRNAPAERERAEHLAGTAAGRHGLSPRPARMAVELVLPAAPDKGSAVASLAAGARAACFLGDDSGDLPAFAALDELRDRTAAYTSRIAVASDESPPDLLLAADVVLDGPASALAFLAAIADRSGAR